MTALQPSPAPAAPRGRDDAPILEAEGLVRRFRGRTAVDDVSLRIAPGEVLGFLGLNGAGKTTTIRMLCGLLAPNAGQIRIDGIDLRADPARAVPRIGYVPDRCRVHPWMRIGEAIDFCARLRPAWDDDVANRMLDVFRLEPRKRVRELSKGMAAKLALLLAIAGRPPILILDEPLSGLDPVVHDEFLDGVLRQVIDRGQTVMFSTHDLADVQRLADTVTIMHEGRVRESGSLVDVLGRARKLEVILDDAAAGAIADGTSDGVPRAPAGTIAQRLDRRTWELVVRDVDAGGLERLRAASGVRDVRAHELSLTELFKAHVAGDDGALTIAPGPMDADDPTPATTSEPEVAA